MRELLKLWLSCDDALPFIEAATGKDLSPQGGCLAERNCAREVKSRR